MTKRMHKTLENTRFAGAPVIPVAARPGGPEVNINLPSEKKYFKSFNRILSLLVLCSSRLNYVFPVVNG